MIGDKDETRKTWPLAVIEEVIPGTDGRIRLVRQRQANGNLINRAIQSVYTLELNENESGEVTERVEDEGTGTPDIEETESIPGAVDEYTLS